MLKLYAIVNKGLDKSYQGVQLGHVSSVVASKNTGVDWNNQTFVYLKAGRLKMERFKSTLNDAGVEYFEFYEPDIDENTAIACLTDKESLFRSFELF